MTKEKKDWKEQAEELAEKSEKVREEINSYLSKSKQKEAKRNPESFEENVLTGINLLIEQHERMLGWMSSFEWISKKLWWISIFVTLWIAIFVGIVF